MKSLRKPYKKPIDLTLETDIKDQIRESINSSGLGIVWRQNSGTVRSKGYYVKLSKTGSADLTGVTRYGKRLEIEVKRPHEKQNEEQINFQIFIEKWGGIYIMATSAEEALLSLKKRLGV